MKELTNHLMLQSPLNSVLPSRKCEIHRISLYSWSHGNSEDDATELGIRHSFLDVDVEVDLVLIHVPPTVFQNNILFSRRTLLRIPDNASYKSHYFFGLLGSYL